MPESDNTHALQRLADLALPVAYEPAFLAQQEAWTLFRTLLAEIAFDAASRIRMWGRDIPIPRLQVAFGDPGTRYRFSGVEVAARPWTTTLVRVRDQVCRCARARRRPNFVLVNLYRDGLDRIGPHADALADMVPGADVYSLSLGAVRDFVMHTPEARVSLTLEHGSLLTLSYRSLQGAKHALPARKTVRDARLNLTFRTLVPER